jgi:dienelactone hydrolase
VRAQDCCVRSSSETRIYPSLAFVYGLFFASDVPVAKGAAEVSPMIKMFLLFLFLSAAPVAAQVRIYPESATSGFSPGIRVTGLSPGAKARLHAYASYGRWEQDASGKWVEKTQVYHAWANVVANARGEVAMDRYSVTSGTYAGVDGYGLLWSMRKPTDPILAQASPSGEKAPRAEPGKTVLLLTQDGVVIGHGSFRILEPSGLTAVPVSQGRVNGFFAAPTGKRKLPTVILLHGSEGGGAQEARDQATRFAGRGFAAFALNYFAWDLKGLKGPPNYHVNQPVELIGQVRDWLANRPEADVKRLGIYGHSKGAEYAVVAAQYYPWVKAVAACTPSDAVWEGYGINDGRNRFNPQLKWPAEISSWSWQGKPLPYIPLRTYENPPEGRKWFDNADRYSTSRTEKPDKAQKALIEIEKSRAHFLLLGGGRDEVWASGTMAESLAERMRKAGKGSRVIVQVYPAAGHQICGAGTYPSHIWADASTDPRVKDPVAEGAAQVDAWRRIVHFFKTRL